jgi:predicted RNA-binding protein
MASKQKVISVRPKRKLIDRNRIFEWHEMDAKERKEFVKEVISRLKELMQKHIGRERAINSEELFEAIYMITPETLSDYEARFWRDMLNRIIYHLRNKEELFIVNESGKYIYVLKTVEELLIFKGIMNKYIEGCELMKTKATRWVKERKWESS